GNSWFLTSGFTSEDRTGGTQPGRLLPDGQPFPEELDTRRADAGSVARRVLGPSSVLSLRASATEEWRTHGFGAATERDRRNTLFAEAALTTGRGPHTLVLGTAVERDDYHARDV